MLAAPQFQRIQRTQLPPNHPPNLQVHGNSPITAFPKESRPVTNPRESVAFAEFWCRLTPTQIAFLQVLVSDREDLHRRARARRFEQRHGTRSLRLSSGINAIARRWLMAALITSTTFAVKSKHAAALADALVAWKSAPAKLRNQGQRRFVARPVPKPAGSPVPYKDAVAWLCACARQHVQQRSLTVGAHATRNATVAETGETTPGARNVPMETRVVSPSTGTGVPLAAFGAEREIPAAPKSSHQAMAIPKSPHLSLCYNNFAWVEPFPRRARKSQETLLVPSDPRVPIISKPPPNPMKDFKGGQIFLDSPIKTIDPTIRPPSPSRACDGEAIQLANGNILLKNDTAGEVNPLPCINSISNR